MFLGACVVFIFCDIELGVIELGVCVVLFFADIECPEMREG